MIRHEPIEPREGMVMVYDWNGGYLGCMGVQRWHRLLRDDNLIGGAMADQQFLALVDALEEWFPPVLSDRELALVGAAWAKGIERGRELERLDCGPLSNTPQDQAAQDTPDAA